MLTEIASLNKSFEVVLFSTKLFMKEISLSLIKYQQSRTVWLELEFRGNSSYVNLFMHFHQIYHTLAISNS